MTILASLVKAYERLPNAPPFGYSSQSIYFCLELNADGRICGKPLSLSNDKKGRPAARRLNVPYFGGRSGKNPPPYFLWDNSAYVLGVTGKDMDAWKRFEAFRNYHITSLSGAVSPGLRAFVKFLELWSPEQINQLDLPSEIIDRNIVFRFTEERSFLHDSEEAQLVWKNINAPDTIGEGVCLISGEREPIARLHPPIATFENPARIVSFDLDNDAFSSYGHIQAENAPTGISSAFKYTAVLNNFLLSGSGHRIQIANTSTLFWADSSKIDVAALAEAYGSVMFDAEEEGQAVADQSRDKIRTNLQRIVHGASLSSVEPDLGEDVDFFILGLAPNAARISIRFYWQGNFGTLTDNYRAYMRDLSFRPWPTEKPQPSFRQCIARLGVARIDRAGKVTFDQDQVPDQFAGEFMRAAITGNRFPSGLLGHLLMRIRSDHLLDPVRIAMVKAILTRDLRLLKRLPNKKDGKPDEDYLMTPDPDDPNIARRLGRIFALMERIQSASLGEEVNATIKDKYLSAAAATPQQVFSGLMTLTETHLSRLRRGHSDAKWVAKAAGNSKPQVGTAEMARRIGAGLGSQYGRLIASLPGLPQQHDRDEQGYFLIGYYQERYATRGGPENEAGPDVDHEAISENEE